MTFLQPLLLAALPLVALPVIIHLINQRRYQTMPWAAMMFLLAANRLSRGHARLRQLLIMLFRMLAIATLIFTISRPLASGWLGLAAGGRPDTTIILLDRSPSMQQQGSTPASKLKTGREQLARTLALVGSDRWVLIESTTNSPRRIDSPEALVSMPATEAASSTADVPLMLEAARDFIHKNKTGRTEIWICSDVRASDWNADSSLWSTLRDSFAEFPQSIRFHLLAYSDVAADNVGVRVTEVRRRETSQGAELLVSLELTRDGDAPSNASLPIRFEIDGARSETTVRLEGQTTELTDHRLPIDRSQLRGWGRISIPADANPSDNDFYFVFDRPQTRRTLIVSDDPEVDGLLQLAASIPPTASVECAAEVVTMDQLPTTDWESVSLVLWHARLPDASAAVDAFVRRGGQVIFFPPNQLADGAFREVRWENWVEGEIEVPVSTWRGDQDLLAHTRSGTALPVGDLRIRRYCRLKGDVTPLATLQGGGPLLARIPSDRGGVYFCSTTVSGPDSSFGSNGVVLYVMLQRALATGTEVLGQTREIVAGSQAQAVPWRQLAGPPEALSTEYPHHQGVYRAGEKLLAVNRDASEDQADVLSDERVAELFAGLDFVRVDDQAGSLAALVQEIWRLFLGAMMVAMLVEAALCLPRKPTRAKSEWPQVRKTQASSTASPTAPTKVGG